MMKDKIKKLNEEVEELIKKYEDKNALVDIVKAIEIGKAIQKVSMA